MQVVKQKTQNCVNREIFMALDYRKRSTQKLVKETMIELLEEKPLHKIKVKELCEKAGINRATFYHNFEDIYNVYEVLENDFYREYAKMISDETMLESSMAIKKMFYKQIKYICENKRLFMIFYRSDRCSILLEKMMEEETRWMVSSLDYIKWIKDDTIAFDSEESLRKMNIFAINGTFGLLYTLFLRNEEIECEKITETLLKFFYKKMLVK